MDGLSHPVSTPAATDSSMRKELLWKKSQELEAGFLAEMLKAAGIGRAREAFGGGAGEDQFASFLIREYATATVASGGIGLSEAIYDSLLKAQGDQE